MEANAWGGRGVGAWRSSRKHKFGWVVIGESGWLNVVLSSQGLCGVSQWQEQSSETYLVPGPVGGQPGLTAKTCLCSRAQWAAHAVRQDPAGMADGPGRM